MDEKPLIDRDLLDLFSGLIDKETENMILEILCTTSDEEDALDQVVRALVGGNYDQD